MTDYLPPPRSIVRVQLAEDGIEVWCDCATITVLQFDGVPDKPVEAAFTCDGCQSTHWFTFGPAQVTP